MLFHSFHRKLYLKHIMIYSQNFFKLGFELYVFVDEDCHLILCSAVFIGTQKELGPLLVIKF
jgi:hypothetical protein